MVTSECDISDLIRAARFIHEFMQMLSKDEFITPYTATIPSKYTPMRHR